MQNVYDDGPVVFFFFFARAVAVSKRYTGNDDRDKQPGVALWAQLTKWKTTASASIPHRVIPVVSITIERWSWYGNEHRSVGLVVVSI